MLVLSRKINDTIIIGDNIKLQVVKIKGNTVRLGIEAPVDVKILRGELAPYGVEPDHTANPEQKEAGGTSGGFANSSTSIEFEMNLEDLPNPFVVAHAG